MLFLSSIKTLCVWSENPVKIGAVKQVFEELGLQVEVVWKEVDRGISEMPMSSRETEQWSYNRAKACMALGDFDVTLWLEGGVFQEINVHGEEVWYLTGCATVIDRNGYVATWRAGNVVLPPLVIDRLKQWEELGPIMDALTQQEKVKHKNGARGFFTNDLITRQQSFRDSVVTALAPWFHPDLYGTRPWVH